MTVDALRLQILHPEAKEPHISSEFIPTEIRDAFSVSLFADVSEQF